jgi:hypothetical protein
MNYENMSKQELLAEMNKIQKQLNKMQEIVDVRETKELKIGEFTAKDVGVRYGDCDGYGEQLWFSLVIKRDGKEYDFYYGRSDDGAGDWWPKNEDEPDDKYNCGAFDEFIPTGFYEVCENSYEFRGTLKQAIKRLKQYGITDVKLADWHIGDPPK